LVLFDIVIELYVPIPNYLEEAIPVFKQMALGLLLMLMLLYRPLGILGRMRRDKIVRSVDHV
jgi:ABC-type branched-subunit amino acid transport system permease subunit